MHPAVKVGAVVLAAGRSSRMGTSKLLLPLGSTSAIERVVAAVRRAGVGDVVVVTGHGADEIAPVFGGPAGLDGPPIRRVHNPGYESGMFSSVQAGVGALESDVDAFFVLPADYSLVRPQVLETLLRSFRDRAGGILHPTCCGLRGHPPLISGDYRPGIAAAGPGGSLREFFEHHATHEVEVDVQDMTILMDMDTPDDHMVLNRFAALLDATEDTPDDPPASLTPEDAFYLLALLQVPRPIVYHCRTVAAVGKALADALAPRVPGLRVDLVHAACLLHDMARSGPRHGAVGQALLANLGAPRLGSIVGMHMMLPLDALQAPPVTEEELVYLADKLVVDDKVGTLEEREARALRRWGGDPAALPRLQAKMTIAELIRRRVESLLEHPLEEVLPRERPSSI